VEGMTGSQVEGMTGSQVEGMTGSQVEAPQKKELYIFPHDSICVTKMDQSWNKFQSLKDETNVDLLG